MSLFIINGLHRTCELFQNVIEILIKGSSNISECSTKPSQTSQPKTPAWVDWHEGDIGQGAVLVDEDGVGAVDADIGGGVGRGLGVGGGVHIDLDVGGEGGVGQQRRVTRILGITQCFNLNYLSGGD